MKEILSIQERLRDAYQCDVDFGLRAAGLDVPVVAVGAWDFGDSYHQGEVAVVSESRLQAGSRRTSEEGMKSELFHLIQIPFLNEVNDIVKRVMATQALDENERALLLGAMASAFVVAMRHTDGTVFESFITATNFYSNQSEDEILAELEKMKALMQ